MVQLAPGYDAVIIYSQYNVAKAELDCRINIDGINNKKRYRFGLASDLKL